MPQEVLDHIFDPFYTTKPVGTGTGLGLAICYLIVVNHHNGTIEVKTSPDEGTSLLITLPIEQTIGPQQILAAD